MRKKQIDWQGIAICVVSLLAVSMFLWYVLTIRAEDTHFDNETVYPVNTEWHAQVDGRDYPVTLPAQVDAGKEDTVLFRKVLKKQAGYCNTLMVHTAHQYLRFLLDGEVLYTYGMDQITPVDMSPGSPWQCVRLPEGWEGKELVIETKAYYDSTAGYMDEVYLGTKNALVFMVLKNAWLSLVLNLPVMIAGVVMVLVSFFFKQKEAVRRMRYIGCFALIASTWILLESKISQIFTGSTLVCMNLIFILFALLPVYILYYLLSYPIFNRSRYMKTVYGLSAVSYVAIQLLRVFGIMDYMETVSLVHGTLMLAVAGVIFIYIKEKRECWTLPADVKRLFIAIFVFAGFGLLDVIRFYLPTGTADAVAFTRIGMFCFILILAYSAMQQEAEEQEKKVEQQVLEKLAFTDMLTGLKNRTAFEAQMDQYRQGVLYGEPQILVTDMNGLKNVNDTYGHASGDKALVRIAEKLSRNFGDKGECYRIGGDEFCVISKLLTEEEMQVRMERFMQAVAKEETGMECGVTVASGYARCGVEGIDEAFKVADHEMYCCKAIMKAGMK